MRRFLLWLLALSALAALAAFAMADRKERIPRSFQWANPPETSETEPAGESL